MRDQEKDAKPPQLAQTGWCGQEFLDHTTPSAPSKEASRLLLDVAATPPLLRRGVRVRAKGRDERSMISGMDRDN